MIRLCWHSWTDWSEARDQRVDPTCSSKVQISTCTKCNKIKIKRVFSSAYIAIEVLNGPNQQKVEPGK